jgi:MFS family permease
MVATAYQIFVLAVLASTFIDEFDLSRFELGLIGSLNTAVGAVSAPWTGRLTDRIGPRRSTMAAQLIVAAGFAVMALANTVTMLVLSATILGIPQGWGNPATNALIAERVPPGNRGTVTGIKQSGVQMGIFLAGATLPFLSDRVGWRGGIWIYAGIFAALAFLPLLLPSKVEPFSAEAQSLATDQDAKPYDMRAVWLIAVYAFLMGTVGGGIARFLALFAEEEVGLSPSTAGWVIAVSGLAGMAARVVAGQLAETRFRPLPMLSGLAAIGASVPLLLMGVLTVGSWILWPIAVLFAIGHGAWNAVAMLAIIVGVPKAEAGRASGAVMFGFLGGLAVGAPVAGLVIDATNSYQLVWVAGFVLSALSAIVARYAHRNAAQAT